MVDLTLETAGRSLALPADTFAAFSRLLSRCFLAHDVKPSQPIAVWRDSRLSGQPAK